MQTYYVYITTNVTRKVLYTGVTNYLKRRLHEHREDSLKDKKHFTGKYNTHLLLYWESFGTMAEAIQREKQIKGWLREKKIELIRAFNPDFIFLNDRI
ncbi:MAG: GIY-YIG nuclease family protein [Alistipes sp.]|nr:GIY-YIG nuclease family protein [Alistipes sp.]